jgi:copper chaperone
MLGTLKSCFANQSKEANMQFHIENMTCSGCARSVTTAIQSLDKGAVIKADPENHKIDVETSAARAEIEAVLVEAGYPAAREAA